LGQDFLPFRFPPFYIKARGAMETLRKINRRINNSKVKRDNNVQILSKIYSKILWIFSGICPIFGTPFKGFECIFFNLAGLGINEDFPFNPHRP
jgi:hypothetical protein